MLPRPFAPVVFENRLLPVVEENAKPVDCGINGEVGFDCVGVVVFGKLKLGRLSWEGAPVAFVFTPLVPLVAALPVVAGGRDSTKEAPKDEVGLNALRPAKPVTCGCNGWVPTEEGLVPVDVPKDKLENASENAEVDVDVIWGFIWDGVGDCAVKGDDDGLFVFAGDTNAEATDDMFAFGCPGVPLSPRAEANRDENGC